MKIKKSNKEWRELLDLQTFNVTRKKGTEAPFSGKLYSITDKGTYVCACCQAELFSSDTKYDSKTGWPSFYQPISDDCIDEYEDNGLFRKRIEVVCSRCDSHLGHVFNDGPPPTNLRYCLNSVALNFVKDK